MLTTLNIFCNFTHNRQAVELLRRDTSAHNLILASDTRPDWNSIDVAFGQPDLQAVLSLPRLKWIHVSSAGYTRYDSAEVREALKQRGATLTNSSHVFDEPCAQHLLAMMLALSRGLLPCYGAQLDARGWNDARHRAESFLLREQQVLVLGFGAIAKRLVQMLQPFEMKITAVRRKPEPFPGVQVLGEDKLTDALAKANHVVSTLPDSSSTRHFMDAERFGAMKPGAFFYNVGRGTTVDQDALLQVLEAGHLGAAYLDVTEPEPLPPEHFLWRAPNCFITPHTAGGHRGEAERVVQHFIANLRRFEQGEELEDRVF